MKAPAPLSEEVTPWPDLESLRAEIQHKEGELLALKRRLQAIIRPNSPASVERRPSIHDDSEKPLSVIIPMGGLGTEFAEAGFRMPKPLVNVVGRPVLLWVLDHLSLRPTDSVFLAVPAAIMRQFDLERIVRRLLPQIEFKVVVLPFETRGWLETVLSVTRQMSAKESRNGLVTLDCSTIYHGVDILHVCRAHSGSHASVFFDLDKASGPGAMQRATFSYIRLSEDSKILEVKEKSIISSQANCGTYIFSNAVEFRSAAEALLEHPEEAAKGGLYASSLMSWMMGRGAEFAGIPVQYNDVAIVSNLAQLQAFMQKVSCGQVPMAKKMRFCFDLDGTLVTHAPDSATPCQLLGSAVELLRQLHAAGHTIIITTSRGMPHGGGVDRAIATQGYETFKLLEEFAIPYDELHFGKPHADVYVDAHAINSQGDLNRDLGWFSGSGEQALAVLDGAIDARSFNMVRSAGKSHVIKSSKSEVLKGECHWYRSIPASLAQYFPQLIEIEEGDASCIDAVSSITMAKVAGVTFSHLVTARLLLPEWVRRLVRALRTIHTQQPEEGSALSRERRAGNADLCSNYGSKVKKRTMEHMTLYESLADDLGINFRTMFDVLIGFLDEFEASQRAHHAFYIHGDPVFSNILRTSDDKIVMIDMRGQLGKWTTTQGDVHYDLSKVFQSLCGYDFMLLDQALDEPASETFDALRAAFWEEVRQRYPDVSHRQVRLLTASHFFTIVPLHEVRSRMARYLRTAHSMLHVEGLL
ncbi:unnamed protein product [Symbiodinium pilosum]|uniref:Nucleotidyl transferase domain-containing protein n=1 Tax=Symbiodinium pilosum TaxID=2952 RepID=A0A812T8Z6_SYMPI|nr:unnamed protein product [Symbiodinium pilosum]